MPTWMALQWVSSRDAIWSAWSFACAASSLSFSVQLLVASLRLLVRVWIVASVWALRAPCRDVLANHDTVKCAVCRPLHMLISLGHSCTPRIMYWHKLENHDIGDICKCCGGNGTYMTFTFLCQSQLPCCQLVLCILQFNLKACSQCSNCRKGDPRDSGGAR